MAGKLSIGEVAKRTGIPVKTLRFYADEGLLPPSGRSRANYRLFSEQDVVKLDLIRTLREAGVGLEVIRAVLGSDLTLKAALELRLSAIEAHITSLRRVAAALRAALRNDPSERDIRRLANVTKLSNEERKAVIEGFYRKVAEGIPIDEAWMKKMIGASAPALPDDPTPEQLDAWLELSELISDPKFVASLRANAQEVWKPGFDLAALRALNEQVLELAKQPLAAGEPETSDAARAVAETYLAGLARMAQRTADDPAFRAGVRQRFERQDPRASRYWELVAVLNGKHEMSGHVAEWRWISAALLRLLAS